MAQSLGIRFQGRPQPIADEAQISNADVQAAGYATQVSNINFGCIFEAPEWSGLRAIARYWWFFGDHNGLQVRCAHFESFETLEATLTILPAGNEISTTLSLTALKALAPIEYGGNSSNNHFSSPDEWIDNERQIFFIYWHATAVDGSNNGWRHGAGVGVSGADLSEIRARVLIILTFQGYVPEGGLTLSQYVEATLADVPAEDVGLTYRLVNVQLGKDQTGNPTYFRFFRKQIGSGEECFAFSNQADLRRSELDGVPDDLGLSPFVSLADPNAFTAPIAQVANRHNGIQLNFDFDRIGFWTSRPEESTLDATEPEQWLYCEVDVSSDDWEEWFIIADTFVQSRRPMLSWEGVLIAITPNPTAVPGPQNIQMDPGVYPKDCTNYSGRVYMHGCTMGEQFLAVYLLNQATFRATT